jgi:hypothetical protein
MSSVDMCEHDWPGSGCRECFPDPLENLKAILIDKYNLIPETVTLYHDDNGILHLEGRINGKIEYVSITGTVEDA